MAGTEAFGIVIMNLVALVVMGGAGIPLGIPPEEENPLMAKSAPEDCVVYFSWASRQTEIDPKSPNSTEKILAEPSVQALIDSAFDALGGSSDGIAGVSEEEGAKELREVTSRLARLVFTNAGAVFISDIKNDLPIGGLLLDVGSEADALRTSLLALQAKNYKGDEIATTEHFDATFYWLPQSQPGEPKIAWGVKGHYLIVGLGEGSIKSIFANASTAPPKWLTDAQASAGVERRAQIGYLDLRRIMEEAAKQEGQTLEEIDALKKIGIADITHATYVSGLNETGFETHVHMHTGGERIGLLSVLNGKPLALADLKGIPADAAMVSAMRLNIGDFYDEMSKITKAEIGEDEYNNGIKTAEDQLGFSIRDGLIASLGDVWRAYSSPTEGGVVTGWTMVADIKDRQKLESLNAQLVKAVNDYADANPNQGKDWGRSFEEPRAVPFEEPRFDGELEEESSEAEPERSFGRAEILPRTESAKDAVRDAAANDECFDDPFGATEEAADATDGEAFGVEEFEVDEFGEEHIGGPVGMADTPFGELFQTMFVGSLRIKEKEVAGKKYYMAHFTSYLVPVAPSWGFTDKHLVVGLFPQTVKEFLTRPDDFQSLDTNPEIASRLGDDTLGVAQVDSKAMFETIYSFLEMGMFSAATVDSGEADDSAALLNAITNMPATADIAQHIGPSTILIRPTDQGIEMISHQSFPGGGVGALAPVAVAAMAPAVMAARAAARQAQATNNLKQLGLAMHNYHDVYTHFPAAYTADKEGKPLLSWRVHLLPFIEGGALYEKFHLDEPWDSDHNKKLIAEMPAFLMAPGSTAAAGKTTYLGVYGDSFIFSKPKGDGRKGNGMRDVTDGTSNTIMIVEASDESAVIWTKPDDFTPDAMNPWSGLIGLRKEGFLAGFTDGSVSIINKNDNNKGLMALFTRNGGEPVSRWDFEFGADEIPDFGPEPDFIEEPDFGEEPRFEESVPEFSPDRAVPE